MNYKRPCVSIGLPVFNGENYLEESIDSILNQTYKDFELIISDNGSTDRTQAICAAYAAKDSRIRTYRSKQNRGAAWNYNNVFKLSLGKYFKWHAHDDKCEPTYLEQCVSMLDREPALVVAYPKTMLIDANGQHIQQYDDHLDLRMSRPAARYRRYHERYRQPSALCNPIFGVIRTKTLGATPLIGHYPGSDQVLLAELALHGGFGEIAEPLFLRRQHPLSSLAAHPTFRERIAWFDTSKVGYIPRFGWRWFYLAEYCRGIQRVPLAFHEKAQCYWTLAPWLSERWAALLKDMIWDTQQRFLRHPAGVLLKQTLKSVKI